MIYEAVAKETDRSNVTKIRLSISFFLIYFYLVINNETDNPIFIIIIYAVHTYFSIKLFKFEGRKKKYYSIWFWEAQYKYIIPKAFKNTSWIQPLMGHAARANDFDIHTNTILPSIKSNQLLYTPYMFFFQINKC